MADKGKGGNSLDSKAVEVSPGIGDMSQLIAYLQGLQVQGASTAASSSGGFVLSPIAKSRSGSQELRKPGTKVLSANSVQYWTALGGPRKIRDLRKEWNVAPPLCRARGIMDAKDLVTGDKAVVLRNEGSRYQVEVEDFTSGNTLPTFSLIFTEFESEGFLFHTTWQWEVGTWQERASSVWDVLTLEILDCAIPATIYATKKEGTYEAWKLFE
jgi:hypothetical protein